MLIAGNWKMNTDLPEGRTLAENIASGIAEAGSAFEAVDFAVCPSFVHLQAVGAALSDAPVALGAQDVHTADEGAYTSDVSAPMLTSVGCHYVIVGHSERRQYYDETDATVNQKALQARAHDLVPIICVGETLGQRKGGEAASVVRAQLDGALDGLSADTADDLVIAYEPVWAIGTGESATPAQAQDMHAVIRSDLEARYGSQIGGGVPVLYGGSMKPHNAADLLSEPDVDGGLIGSASLEAESFLGIAERAAAVLEGRAS
jgi:triosephosphate isomerase